MKLEGAHTAVPALRIAVGRQKDEPITGDALLAQRAGQPQQLRRIGELARAPQPIELLAALTQPVKVLLAERLETGVNSLASRGFALRDSLHGRRRGGCGTEAQGLGPYATLNRRAQHDVARGITEGQTDGVGLHLKHQAAGLDRRSGLRPASPPYREVDLRPLA